MTTLVWMETKYEMGRLTALAVATADIYQPFGATMLVNQAFGAKGPGVGFDEKLAELIPEMSCLAGYHAGYQHRNLTKVLPATQKKLRASVMDVYSVVSFAVAHGMDVPTENLTGLSVGERLAQALMLGKLCSDFFLTKTLH